MTTELVAKYAGPPLKLKSDQGSADNFLTGDVDQLQPQVFVDAASKNANVSLDYELREGYDHSYFFIATFIADHIAFHKANL